MAKKPSRAKGKPGPAKPAPQPGKAPGQGRSPHPHRAPQPSPVKPGGGGGGGGPGQHKRAHHVQPGGPAKRAKAHKKRGAPHPSPMKRAGGGPPHVQPGGPMIPASGGGRGRPPVVQPGGPMIPARHGRKGRPHPSPMKPAGGHGRRGLAGPALDGWWITGGNGELANCAAVAAANCLLLSSGLRVGDAELARLHDRAGPLSVAGALRAFAPRALAEIQPGGLARDGMVAGLATPYGPHAALVYADCLVTWGGLIEWPDDWLLEEAWAVTW